MLNPSQADGGLNYWADQTDIQIKAVDAWALRAMRAAADHEDSTDKAAVTPGPIKPAREQLGEMLAEAKRPAEALAEFERAMAKEPNRLRAMWGAAQAADATGDRAKARGYYGQLATLLARSDAGHPAATRAKTAAN